MCDCVCVVENHNNDEQSMRRDSPMNDVITPSVATTVLNTDQQQHVPDNHQPQPQQQQQQRGKWNQQQAAVVNGARRNVYRTNSRRRYDLTPAVRRCVVTDKSLDVTADNTDTTHQQPQQQQQTTLFSRRYVINLDPLTPRATVDPVRPGRANVLATTGAAGKTRWQRQQTTYQLTPRALRTARTDASAGARLTTRRERTLTDENFLSATGKKLLDGSATCRNGETCRVVELKLNGANTQTHAVHSSEPTRRQQQQQQHRTATNTALSLHHSDSINHDSAGTAGGIILPQLATHR